MKATVEPIVNPVEAVVSQSSSSSTHPLSSPPPHPLLRNVAAGMNPVTLITGFYGPRGERIRHPVNEGALRLPQNALDRMMMTTMTTTLDDDDTNKTVYTLPALDTVKRPSLDVNDTTTGTHPPLVVTEVYNEDVIQEDISPTDGTIHTTTYTKTIIQHFHILRPVSAVVATAGNDMERIRGGGGGVDGEAVGETDGEGSTEITTASEVLRVIPSTTLLPVVPTTTPPQDSSITTTTTTIPSSIIHPEISSISPPPLLPPLTSGTDGGKDDATNHLDIAKTESVPMDIDPVVVIVAVDDDTKATATPTAAVMPPAPPMPSVPLPAVVTVATVPVPVMATPADPTLQQQQISSMEKALLSTITSNNNISKNNNNNPTATTSSGNTTISTVPAPAPALALVVPETKIPATVTSSTSTSENVTTQPVNVTSASSTTLEVTKEPEAHVIPLAKRPLEQYETHTVQSTTHHNTTRTTSSSSQPNHYPAWFTSDRAAPLEQAVLSEWFDGSATHRTEQSYLVAREMILEMSNTIGPDHYLTATMVRRSIPGDAGSLLRLHAFLTSHSMINQNAINESAPTPMILMNNHNSNKKAKVTTNDWDTDEGLKMNLMQAVVEYSRTMANSKDHVDMDWNAIATVVGHGVTGTECEHQFLTMSIPTEKNLNDNTLRSTTNMDGSITPDVVSVSTTYDPPSTIQQMQQNWMADLVNRVDPTVLRTVTTAALSSTNGDLPQAQKAALLGCIVHDTVDMVQEQEARVVQILSEVMELRMQRIESRLSTLDDVEDMLEAERVALELERRDLYTARCRHWFGGT